MGSGAQTQVIRFVWHAELSLWFLILIVNWLNEMEQVDLVFAPVFLPVRSDCSELQKLQTDEISCPSDTPCIVEPLSRRQEESMTAEQLRAVHSH